MKLLTIDSPTIDSSSLHHIVLRNAGNFWKCKMLIKNPERTWLSLHGCQIWKMYLFFPLPHQDFRWRNMCITTDWFLFPWICSWHVTIKSNLPQKYWMLHSQCSFLWETFTTVKTHATRISLYLHRRKYYIVNQMNMSKVPAIKIMFIINWQDIDKKICQPSLHLYEPMKYNTLRETRKTS